MRQLLQKTFSVLTILLFALLPFHALLTTFLKFKLDIPLPVSVWKEGILVLLLGITFLDLVRRKILDSRLRTLDGSNKMKDGPRSPFSVLRSMFDSLDLAIFTYLGIGLLSSILQFLKLGNASFIRIGYGFKYDFLMFCVFFLFRQSRLISEELKKKVFKIVFATSIIVVVFALLQATILPRNFLEHFGYSPNVSAWTVDGPLPIYHALDKNNDTMRIASTFSGPNQFGIYLLIPFFLFLVKAVESLRLRNLQSHSPIVAPKSPNPPELNSGQALFQRGRFHILHSTFYILFSLLTFICIFLSYSRSALLGAIFGGVVFAVLVLFQRKMNLASFAQKYWKKILGAFIAALILMGGVVYTLKDSSLIHSLVVRTSSSQGHWQRSTDGFVYTFEKPILGHGIGDAGPASTRWDPQGIGWIPESWYLQVSLEYGLVGLAVFLAILFLTGKKLWEENQKSKIKNQKSELGSIDQDALMDFDIQPNLPLTAYHFSLFLSLIAICIASVTLHAWEDSVVSITFWGLAGISLASPWKNSVR